MIVERIVLGNYSCLDAVVGQHNVEHLAVFFKIVVPETRSLGSAQACHFFCYLSLKE
jgi:hypothetical protein